MYTKGSRPEGRRWRVARGKAEWPGWAVQSLPPAGSILSGQGQPMVVMNARG